MKTKLLNFFCKERQDKQLEETEYKNIKKKD